MLRRRDHEGHIVGVPLAVALEQHVHGVRVGGLADVEGALERRGGHSGVVLALHDVELGVHVREEHRRVAAHGVVHHVL